MTCKTRASGFYPTEATSCKFVVTSLLKLPCPVLPPKTTEQIFIPCSGPRIEAIFLTLPQRLKFFWKTHIYIYDAFPPTSANTNLTYPSRFCSYVISFELLSQSLKKLTFLLTSLQFASLQWLLLDPAKICIFSVLQDSFYSS